MRSNPGSIAGRLQYYDRAASNVSISYTATAIAPHAATTRATYTVPAGSRAILSFGVAAHIRTTVATVAGKTTAKVLYTPNGGTQMTLVVAQSDALALATADRAWGEPEMVLFPGDVVILQTADACTNGAVDYDLSAVITQFSP